MSRLCALFLCSLLMCCVSSCKKEDQTVSGNVPKDYSGVATIRVENYVNRMYIDMLGRVPLQTEMIRDVAWLRANNLSFASRDSLINRLQYDTIFVPGDSSYKRAYYQRIYDLCKARFLEGASEDDIGEQLGPLYYSRYSARLTGDSIAVFRAQEQIDLYENVINSRRQYQYGQIGIDEMCARMLNNGIYDIINMNTFNFVRASFDDLFFRFPSEAEFNQAYSIIEENKTGMLFGGSAGNKAEYCRLLTGSREFYEGMIKWCYLSLLARDATTQEVYNLMSDFYTSHNLQKVQRMIMRTDEYANF